MKILYLGNFNNSNNNKAEESIKYALEDMGHEVVSFDEKDYTNEQLWSASKEADLFLFFKLGTSFGKTMEDVRELLSGIECIKVCWYWDKIWGNRYDYMNAIVPLSDFVFMTEGTFFRRMNLINVLELKQGLDKRSCYIGKKKKKFNFDIAFAGSIYGERANWANLMKNTYGGMFNVVNGVFDDDLNDLCASAKIFVAPRYPQDDFYWSNRIYQIVGRGGFMIHPKLHGLTKEFEDGKHVVFYKDEKDMVEKIDYYLEHPEERKKIAKAGMEYCKKNHTYHHALEKMFKLIKSGI